MFRWYMDVEKWTPSDAEFKWLLQVATDEAKDVTKFRKFVDQKRALISRLMQRRMCQLALKADDFAQLDIRRTKGNKPFLFRPRPTEYPNFNYNVSHEGQFVVCSSETTCVCGVDVAAPQAARKDAFESSFLRDFHEQLTPFELRQIMQLPKEEQYDMFQRFWSCKEAFVKARGDGLGFPLGRIDFDLRWKEIVENTPIEVFATVDGKKDGRWRLFQTLLPAKHWVTVARGPVSEIQDEHGAFLSTFSEKTFTDDEWDAALTAPMPAFKEVTIRDLLPQALLAHYPLVCPPLDPVDAPDATDERPVWPVPETRSLCDVC